MIKAIFFDLDGTLLPMNEKEFALGYFHLLWEMIKDRGYENQEKLIKTIWHGTGLMMSNSTGKTNEEVFWDYFASVYGEKSLDDKPLFDEFYRTDFKKSKMFCKDNPLAREIIDFCKENFEKVILSTNPIFPMVGTRSRLSFIGLTPEDFDYVTTYENSYHSKPNPDYFKDLLKALDLKPEEVHLFGNNTVEDGDCSNACGIGCTLIDGCIIDNGNSKGHYPIIKMEDVISELKRLKAS